MPLRLVQPRWPRDGRELFYVAPDRRLMAVRVRLEATCLCWMLVQLWHFFRRRLAAGGNIPAAGSLARAQYAVATDGRFLMNVTDDDAVTSPINVVLNWAALLKKDPIFVPNHGRSEIQAELVTGVPDTVSTVTEASRLSDLAGDNRGTDFLPTTS